MCSSCRAAVAAPDRRGGGDRLASRDRVPEGAKLAVYDLGVGTFDAANLAATDGLRLSGSPTASSTGGITSTGVCSTSGPPVTGGAAAGGDSIRPPC